MHSEMQLVFVGVLTEQARPFLRTKKQFARRGLRARPFVGAGFHARPWILM